MRLRPITDTTGRILCCVPADYDEDHVRRSLTALAPGWKLGEPLDDKAADAWRAHMAEHADACDSSPPDEWPTRAARYLSAAGNVVTTRPKAVR